MELELSLGEAPSPKTCSSGGVGIKAVGLSLGFCMEQERARDDDEKKGRDSIDRRSPDSPPVQLELLPFSPVPRKARIAAESSDQGSQRAFALSPKLGLQWSHEHATSDRSSNGAAAAAALAPVDLVALSPPAASSSPPNSTAASFHLDFSNFAETNTGDNRSDKATSRASDEDENSGGVRKKLRLSKEQSAFLEESFREQSTLNPKQKHALAKQLSLRPRQVEVWFQNRRARTKLKQTEVDCEHLKRCCERLTEENRRLQRELLELRALKATATVHLFYGGHPPATTLSMCPSCERVAAVAAAAANNASSPTPKPANGSVTANPNLKQQPQSRVLVGPKPNCLASAGTPDKS